MDFKGFGDWIEIFRGGKQIDSTGREHDGDALISKAVASFNPSYHEPPIVVGHPKDNAPAFGWVQALKQSGSRLLAKIRDVVPEFEAIAKQGLYKKRSASFYPDGRLRHVGFLGAAPPAVKGLADLKFEDDAGSACFEFNAKNTSAKEETMFANFGEFMEFLKFWKKEADPESGKQTADDGRRETDKNLKSFTEADIEAAKKEAADAERIKVESEFAEKQILAKREAQNKEISTWCEDMVKKGKIAPAWVKSGLPQFMELLAAGSDVIEFGEEKKKSTHYDWLKDLFENQMPKIIEFKEIAGRGDDVSGDAAGKLEILVQKKMKEDKTLTYGAAFSEVQKENPGLAQEYRQELEG
jgi:hypothetical protein